MSSSKEPTYPRISLSQEHKSLLVRIAIVKSLMSSEIERDMANTIHNNIVNWRAASPIEGYLRVVRGWLAEKEAIP